MNKRHQILLVLFALILQNNMDYCETRNFRRALILVKYNSVSNISE